MANVNKQFLALLERPREPVFIPKGKDNIVFDVPAFKGDPYDTERPRMSVRFGASDRDNTVVAVGEAEDPTECQELFQFGREERFSLFLSKHRRLAGKLIDSFLAAGSPEEMVKLAAKSRDRINPQLFSYALTVAVLHRKDTTEANLPSLSEMFPDKFVDGLTMMKARENSIYPKKEEDKVVPIEVEHDFSNIGDEQCLAYFREDYGVNLHHWHWHIVYPNDVDDAKFAGSLAMEVVNKDRRGELFYYMHQQILARYDIERMCNSMKRVERLMDLHEPIPEMYFPKLSNLNMGKPWAPRQSQTVLSNINRMQDDLQFDITDMERWRDRIMAAIDNGKYEKVDGTRKTTVDFKLNAKSEREFGSVSVDPGIDVVGNMIESSRLTPNRKLYGDLHNKGHMAISFIHDPEYRNREEGSVMSDAGTAMRDPIFYRWHAFINHIMQTYKHSLPPYDKNDLSPESLKDISLESFSLESETADESLYNDLQTFWRKRDVELSRGLDFSAGTSKSVLARITHLDHEPFTYTLKVQNNLRFSGKVTVRIFLAPKLDQNGKPMKFNVHKNLFVEMDRFVHTVKPGGNVITRKSIDSNLTIPLEMTFSKLEQGDIQPGQEKSKFCGCGWPQHMLVPKGTFAGFPCVVFAMITDFDHDQVKEDPSAEASSCNGAQIFCGLKNRKYPDRRPMGFPFDRPVSIKGNYSVQNFVDNNKTTMKLIDVTIKHTGQTADPKQ